MKNEADIQYRQVWTELQLAVRESFRKEWFALADAEHKYVLFPKLHHLMSRPTPFFEGE